MIARILFALAAVFLIKQDAGVILPELETITADNIDRIVAIAELDVNYSIDHLGRCEIGFDRDATMLAAVGGSCTELNVWDLSNGERTIANVYDKFYGGKCALCVPFFNAQNDLIIVQYNPLARWYNVTTNFFREYADEEYMIYQYSPEAARFNGRNTLAFVLDRPYPSQLLLVDYETGETIAAVPIGALVDGFSFGDAEFSPDGSYFAVELVSEISIRETRSPDVEIALLDKGDAADSQRSDLTFPTGVEFSLNGDWLVSNQMIWDTETWEPVVVLPESFVDDGGYVEGISPDGSLLYTTHGIWDVKEERLVKEVMWNAIAPNWKIAAQWEGTLSGELKLVLYGVPKTTEPGGVSPPSSP